MGNISVNIIHDNRRSERYEPLIKELEEQGISDYTIWDAVEDIKSVVRSINLSHKKIVRWAKESELKEVCIMEDDVSFPAKNGFEYFLSKKPEQYDIYSACNYLPTSVFTGYVAAPSLVGFHCYLVSERYYDTFLSLPDEGHIDQLQDGVKHQLFICYPYAAVQRPSWSSNNKAMVDYNAILKPEDIYKG